jgi:hypothetical protein
MTGHNTSPAHALLAPSDAARWSTCYGAVALERHLLGEQHGDGGDAFSNEGTDAHTLASDCFAWLDVCGGSPEFYIHAAMGRPMPKGTVVDAEMAHGVLTYVRNVQQYMQAPGYVWSAFERRVYVHGEDGAYLTEGTADFALLVDGGAEVQAHDLKYGKGVKVEAEGNRQLLLYAMGVLALVPEPHLVKRIRVVIHQPRVHLAPSEWECSVEYLLALKRGLHAAAEENCKLIASVKEWAGSEAAFDHLSPSDKACRWCAVKAYCPATIKEIDMKTKAAIPCYHSAPDAPQTIAWNLASIPRIRLWCNAVEQAAMELAQRDALPGYKIVEGRAGSRKWMDEEAVSKLLTEQFGKTFDEVHSTELLSVAQLEKQVYLDDAAWDALNASVTRAPGKPTLAKADDPRPQASTIMMFESATPPPVSSGITDLL